MFSLLEIWNQAKEDHSSVRLENKNYESYIFKGIRISKNSEGIRIYYVNLKAIDYLEIDRSSYDIFKEQGYRDAIYKILKISYKRQITDVNEKIKQEVNYRNNKKHYDSLKLIREELLSKYSKI
jgi:uncharacterized protein (DUF927 family)